MNTHAYTKGAMPLILILNSKNSLLIYVSEIHYTKTRARPSQKKYGFFGKITGIKFITENYKEKIMLKLPFYSDVNNKLHFYTLI